MNYCKKLFRAFKPKVILDLKALKNKSLIVSDCGTHFKLTVSSGRITLYSGLFNIWTLSNSSYEDFAPIHWWPQAIYSRDGCSMVHSSIKENGIKISFWVRDRKEPITQIFIPNENICFQLNHN